MDVKDLKKYTVILEGGSGVLFQPLDETKTYILSAKHVFYKDDPNERGKDTKELKISICYYFSDKQNKPNKIEIIKEENYFEHPDENIDAAILILNENLGFNQIFIDNDCVAFNECLLCGYPSKIDGNTNDRYSNHQINRKIDNTNNGYFRLETNFGNLNHEDIKGFSGGGILRLNKENINIIGIQSSTISDYANGQIDIVPISKFIEIVEKNNLSEMIPSFLTNFNFLKDKAFDFNAGILDENISFTRKILKDKTLEVINSNITPLFIKDLFKDRLLINEKNHAILNDELIYITWLEFLTLINIAKEISCNQDDLEDIFSMTRLLYKNTSDDWQSGDFLGDCMSSNYLGLTENGTVFIKTKSNPIAGNIAYYKLEKGSLVPRINTIRNEYENGTLEVNNIGSAESEIEEFVFDKYNFIHFEYLKKYMLIENSEDFKTFKKSNEEELLIKLKEEYGKVFEI
jgi:hypothetical protein